jgi:dTDP-glucose pyrophosphorylase
LIKNLSNIIASTASIKNAMEQLNELGVNLTLFVLNESNTLLGVLTDGDIRRSLIRGVSVEDVVVKAMQTKFKFVYQNEIDIEVIANYKKDDVKILPIVDKNFGIVELLNLENYKNILPIDVVIMAGGKGKRLLPLTATIPKPLLTVGEKPIIEHNIDRLASFGIKNINISVKYLGQLIEEYFGNGEAKNLNIGYVYENEPLGTVGAVANIEQFNNDAVLIMNSDLLTNIDYEDLYRSFLKSNAAMAIATVSYSVNVPYAVIESEAGFVKSLKEKPTYTYHSNAGIYLVKKEFLSLIPKQTFFNATDLIEVLINKNEKVVSYNIVGYWLDIGKHEDYKKAQEDIKHLSV